MANVADIADEYVSEFAALDPVEATDFGIAGHEHELTDYSPEAADARAELGRRTLRALDESTDDANSLAADVMRERITAALDVHELGEHLRPLAVIGSPVSGVRLCFDLMATDTDHDWEILATRLEAVPDCLASLRAALEAGVQAGLVAARRQAIACSEQAATWGGLDSTTTPFFPTLARRYEAGDQVDAALAGRLGAGAEAATAAYAELAEFLRADYERICTDDDAVGAERYAVLARTYLGDTIDLADTYAWAWEELRRIQTRMAEVGASILPDASLPEVIAHLEGPDGPRIEGEDNLRSWLQEMIDTTIEELHGTHFEIPDRVRVCEAMIAPPGGAAAQYYTSPSEDFSRPGRTWYPTFGRTSFPLWREASICYHEAVPGHHLQVAQVVHLADSLNRFQRLVAWTSGHGEGWALYAERLMAELGYLDDPAFELGMLSAHALRAARVIVDIGMHLELPIPDDESYQPGQVWSAELARPFIEERAFVEPDVVASEVDRYLGLPAQAISYKVGEKAWLECRADAMQRHGNAFDLKAFHSHALDLGNMGLGQLRTELERF